MGNNYCYMYVSRLSQLALRLSSLVLSGTRPVFDTQNNGYCQHWIQQERFGWDPLQRSAKFYTNDLNILIHSNTWGYLVAQFQYNTVRIRNRTFIVFVIVIISYHHSHTLSESSCTWQLISPSRLHISTDWNYPNLPCLTTSATRWIPKRLTKPLYTSYPSKTFHTFTSPSYALFSSNKPCRFLAFHVPMSQSHM